MQIIKLRFIFINDIFVKTTCLSYFCSRRYGRPQTRDIMHLHDIIDTIARERIVERLAANICKTSRPDIDDLVQYVYESLLTCDEEKIANLYEKGQLVFFIVRIIQNQYFSQTSTYYREMRRFVTHTYALDEIRYRHEE